MLLIALHPVMGSQIQQTVSVKSSTDWYASDRSQTSIVSVFLFNLLIPVFIRFPHFNFSRYMLISQDEPPARPSDPPARVSTGNEVKRYEYCEDDPEI